MVIRGFRAPAWTWLAVHGGHLQGPCLAGHAPGRTTRKTAFPAATTAPSADINAPAAKIKDRVARVIQADPAATAASGLTYSTVSDTEATAAPPDSAASRKLRSKRSGRLRTPA